MYRRVGIPLWRWPGVGRGNSSHLSLWLFRVDCMVYQLAADSYSKSCFLSGTIMPPKYSDDSSEDESSQSDSSTSSNESNANIAEEPTARKNPPQ